MMFINVNIIIVTNIRNVSKKTVSTLKNTFGKWYGKLKLQKSLFHVEK